MDFALPGAWDGAPTERQKVSVSGTNGAEEQEIFFQPKITKLQQWRSCNFGMQCVQHRQQGYNKLMVPQLVIVPANRSAPACKIIWLPEKRLDPDLTLVPAMPYCL